jgi:hypothetical protein
MGEVEPPKRINRSDDENIYQPKIHASRIRELYQIGQQLHLPLTVIVDQAIDLYIKQLAETNDEGSINQ